MYITSIEWLFLEESFEFHYSTKVPHGSLVEEENKAQVKNPNFFIQLTLQTTAEEFFDL
jgi:hypothetical protein